MVLTAALSGDLEATSARPGIRLSICNSSVPVSSEPCHLNLKLFWKKKIVAVEKLHEFAARDFEPSLPGCARPGIFLANESDPIRMERLQINNDLRRIIR